MSQATAQLEAITHAAAKESGESLIKFDPSQREFFDDDARVQLVLWHRQKGKDFVAAAKAVDRGMKNGRNWYITSLTQRQADETGKKAEKIFDAYRSLLKLKAKARLDEEQFEEYDAEIDHTFVRTSRKLILPNKAEVVSLPGKNPDTLAGFTGNIILTEFGLFPKGGYEHWRVLFPIVTRNSAMMIPITTPRSKKTKAFELFSAPETYSIHWCDIHKSVSQDGYKLTDNKGEPCSIEAFAKLYGDPAGFQREYELKWTGDADSLITWAQLMACQDAEAKPVILRLTNDQGWNDAVFDFLKNLTGRLELGWDVARDGHLSSIWINHRRLDNKKTLAALVLMQNCEFALMQHIAGKAMDARPDSVGCGDATGIGRESNERLTAKYRENWEGVTFTTKSKSELGSLARATYGEAGQLLPSFMTFTETKFIATDIYSIQCESVGDAADKRLILSETENELEPDSHCDIAYSNFLALKAGTLKGGRRGPAQPPRREKPVGW